MTGRADIEARKREEAKTALFVDDDELHRRLNPLMGRDSFRAAVRQAEKERSPGGRDFPRVSPLWGGRYFPGVLAYLDDFSKVHEHDEDTAGDRQQPQAPQPEQHAPFRKKARPQVHRADGAAVLVREAGGGEHDGISGSVHRLATRR